MSGIAKNDPSNISAAPNTRPEHHLHDTSEPLPGAKGAAPAFDYRPEIIEHTPSSALNENRDNELGQTNPATQKASGGNTAFNTKRPLDVRPTSAGKPGRDLFWLPPVEPTHRWCGHRWRE